MASSIAKCYKKVLLIGATSGIGQSLASKFVEGGAKVIVTGRRKERLDAFVERYPDRSFAIQQDITELESIPDFVDSVLSKHPDLDCLVVNSGIQRALNLNQPQSIDLDSVELEFRTNYLSYIHLIKAFLPFFQRRNSGAMVFTSSTTAIVPIIRCGNYGASKAALHHFLMVLRQNMKDALSDVRIIEIFPPSVQTELHDARHQPDLQNGAQIGMPLEDFTEAAHNAIIRGEEDIVIGAAEEWYYPFEPLRHGRFTELVEKLRDYGK